MSHDAVRTWLSSSERRPTFPKVPLFGARARPSSGRASSRDVSPRTASPRRGSGSRPASPLVTALAGGGGGGGSGGAGAGRRQSLGELTSKDLGNISQDIPAELQGVSVRELIKALGESCRPVGSAVTATNARECTAITVLSGSANRRKAAMKSFTKSQCKHVFAEKFLTTFSNVLLKSFAIINLFTKFEDLDLHYS